MKTIEIDKLITKLDLDPNVVADMVFPGIKHPRLALNRVMAGKAVLNADQISRLSMYTGVPIAELFAGGAWKMKGREKTLSFTAGKYRAELDTETWVTKIYHNETVFHETILQPGSTPLSSFLASIEEVISGYENRDEEE